MQTGEDLANIVGRVAGEIAVESIRTTKKVIENSSKFAGVIAGGITRTVLQMILNKIAERNSLINPGKTNLKNLLRSEKDLKMTDIKAEDVKLFAQKAKRFGLVFAVIKDNDSRHIVYKADDIEKTEKIFKLAIAEKLKIQQKEKELDLSKVESAKDKGLKETTVDKDKNTDKSSIKEDLAKIEAAKYDNTQMKIMKMEKKLSKEQQPPGRKDIDIPNNAISVKAHNAKNKANEGAKLKRENGDLRESVRQKLNNIANSRVASKGTRGKVPVVKRGRDR